MSIIYELIGLILLYIYVSITSLLFSGIDRKLVARMQRRIGPPILQPFYDFLKLMSKETIIPNTANFMFRAAPILMLATVIALLAYTPLGFPPLFATKGDIIVFIYLLTLADFFLILGVISSGSPYGKIGAAREVAMLISREPAMMLGVFSVMWGISKLGVKRPFSLGSLYEHNIWELGPMVWVAGIILIYVFMAWLASEIEVGFFNIPEAEEEIAEGTLVEYSGRYLGIIKLAESIKEFIATSLVVAVLFPWQVRIPGIEGYITNLMIHTLKVFIVLFIAKTVFRTVTGRLRITQAVNLLWTRVFAASVVGPLIGPGGEDMIRLPLLPTVIKNLFKSPATNPFPKTEPIPVPDNFRGRIVYNVDKCVGCRMCVTVCPAGVFVYIPEIRKVALWTGRCVFCKQCVDVCPTGALQMSDEFLLASYDKYDEKFIYVTPQDVEEIKKKQEEIKKAKQKSQ